MTFPNQSQMYPGAPYPYREPPPQIPKNHTFWIAVVLFGTLALVVVGMIVGFWRAAEAPMPTIETPDFEAPPQPPGVPPPPK